MLAPFVSTTFRRVPFPLNIQSIKFDRDLDHILLSFTVYFVVSYAPNYNQWIHIRWRSLHVSSRADVDVTKRITADSYRWIPFSRYWKKPTDARPVFARLSRRWSLTWQFVRSLLRSSNARLEIMVALIVEQHEWEWRSSVPQSWTLRQSFLRKYIRGALPPNHRRACNW